MATFVNQATLSYSGGTITSNIATGEIVEVLSANKTAVSDEYTAGSDVTYAINIINTGATPFTGLTVTDDLGAYPFGQTTLQPLDYQDGSLTVFVDGVLDPAPAVSNTSPLVISGLTVPANGVTTVLYTATVNEYASPAEAGEITNTANIRGGNTVDLTVDETITVTSRPQLSITKSVSPTIVDENGELTYTFVIQNTGNEAAIATDNIVITDTFDPLLSNLTVTYNGAPWSEPTDYTYDEVSGAFATVAGGITVPAATYTQNPITGEWIVTPGTATLTVTGTI